ncbi:MAG: rhomboid family intramembrane serine protease [Candidatus Thermoplasmatota archaeon]|nr:rhomboid family intramembrane serine protease [Candidatus Thermoplasmatota archaeon]
MELTVIPIEPISVIAIVIMAGTLVVAYLKKWMMAYALIIANVIVFILTLLFQYQTPFGNISMLVVDLGFRPGYLSVEQIPQLYTLFTSMFIHGGFLHLFGNMFIFFFIGTAFEQRVGWKNFIIIYLLAGICGTLTHSLVNLGSVTVLIGASGAIFGIMGAFAFSYPRDEVVMPVPIGIMLIMRIKVIYAVILFAAFETIIVYVGVEDTTAHFAHLGGLIGGFILAALLLRKRKTHTTQGQTIYYDSFAPHQGKKIDFSSLQKLATTPELQQMLKKIEAETIPQNRDIWIEHFLEKTVCPKCKNPLNHFDRKIWCEHCGHKTTY